MYFNKRIYIYTILIINGHIHSRYVKYCLQRTLSFKKKYKKKRVQQKYYRTDARQIENGTNNWYSSEKIYSDWEKSTKENNKTIGLNDHANEWISQKDHQNASEERRGTFDFVILEKETEGSLEANHKGQTT